MKSDADIDALYDTYCDALRAACAGLTVNQALAFLAAVSADVRIGVGRMLTLAADGHGGCVLTHKTDTRDVVVHADAAHQRTTHGPAPSVN